MACKCVNELADVLFKVNIPNVTVCDKVPECTNNLNCYTAAVTPNGVFVAEPFTQHYHCSLKGGINAAN